MKTIEWSKASVIQSLQLDGGGETKWVVPGRFFEQFNQALDTVPPLAGKEALYAQFRSLMAVASRDPREQKRSCLYCYRYGAGRSTIKIH
ncbi:hypothetical protein M3I54_17080 [Paraburkholderia sp. CNPSo 3274]|uniref:hypothetical protein n=1 Tax=Paraburkholderia sp. CNPSo 3274 TaxID=2940932 RepID=UPI0020B794E9|nr:hypothetical protein [Paraburkholderia sp. CNPSo 3274]MCP3708686.1 hypothetical protein [Paraburkholderia sp. CNPSo 3274]